MVTRRRPDINGSHLWVCGHCGHLWERQGEDSEGR